MDKSTAGAYIPSKDSQRRGGHRFSRWDDASPEDRFWAKVDKSPGQGPDGDCWGWLAGMRWGGYGHFVVDGKMIAAHRFSYELHHGPIPEGRMVRHTCDNPPCSNPDHLVPGVDQDNKDDMVVRGRSLAGERNPAARHTLIEVLAIREDPRPYKEIMAAYEISKASISRIKNGVSWRNG